MSLLNIWGHITTVPACNSGTLTKVLPHMNAMPQTQDMTPHPITIYRHRADLSLCYPLMWNVTLEYTTTHFNVLGETRPGNPPPVMFLGVMKHSQTLDSGKLVQCIIDCILYTTVKHFSKFRKKEDLPTIQSNLTSACVKNWIFYYHNK